MTGAVTGPPTALFAAVIPRLLTAATPITTAACVIAGRPTLSGLPLRIARAAAIAARRLATAAPPITAPRTRASRPLLTVAPAIAAAAPRAISAARTTLATAPPRSVAALLRAAGPRIALPCFAGAPWRRPVGRPIA